MLSQHLSSLLPPGRRTERGTPDSSGLSLALGALKAPPYLVGGGDPTRCRGRRESFSLFDKVKELRLRYPIGLTGTGLSQTLKGLKIKPAEEVSV